MRRNSLVNTLRSKRHIVLRTLFYISANGLSRAAGLVMLPLLVATLSPEDFSRYGLFTSLIAISVPLLTLNIHTAPGRLFFDFRNKAQQESLLFSALIGALSLIVIGIMLIIIVLTVFAIDDPISEGVLSRKLLVATVLILEVTVNFGQMLLRIHGKGVLYLVVGVSRSAGLIGVYALLSAVRVMPMFEALIIAFIVARVLATIVNFYFYFQQYGVTPVNLPLIRDCVRYSAPTSLHLIALWAINQSGRWIGLIYLSLEDLTPYNLVTQMYAAVAMLSRAIFEALLPDYNSAFGKGDYRRGLRIVRVATLCSVMVVIAIYIVIYFALFIFKFNLPASYSPSRQMLLLAGIVSLLDALYLHGIQLMQAIKATHLQAMATITSGLFTVFFSFIFVQHFDRTGLLLATVLGWSFQAVLTNTIAMRVFFRKTQVSTTK